MQRRKRPSGGNSQVIGVIPHLLGRICVSDCERALTRTLADKPGCKARTWAAAHPGWGELCRSARHRPIAPSPSHISARGHRARPGDQLPPGSEQVPGPAAGTSGVLVHRGILRASGPAAQRTLGTTRCCRAGTADRDRRHEPEVLPVARWCWSGSSGGWPCLASGFRSALRPPGDLPDRQSAP